MASIIKTNWLAKMKRDEYNENAFWEKVKTYAVDAGREVIEAALKLYYSLQDPDTPAWAKTIIVGALIYFITPTDAVPDLVPGGYVDDLGALVGALWTIAEHVKDEHVAKAKRKLVEWFGEA